MLINKLKRIVYLYKDIFSEIENIKLEKSSTFK